LNGILPVVPVLDPLEPVEVAVKHYTEAIQLFNKILNGKWDARFAQIEIPALMEMNRMANYINFYGLQHQLLNLCDGRLLANLNVDLRVCIMWDTDMTDVELEVLEPSGEKCYSFNNKTSLGGMTSRNFTHGYGPQEYLLRCAQAGSYIVSVKLYSSMSKYTGTTVLLWVWTNYGDPKKERKELVVRRLEKDREHHPICKIMFV